MPFFNKKTDDQKKEKDYKKTKKDLEKSKREVEDQKKALELAKQKEIILKRKINEEKIPKEKKTRKIGFIRKKKEITQEEKTQQPEFNETEEITFLEPENEEETEEDKINVFQEVPPNEGEPNVSEEKKIQWSTSKKKDIIFPKDLKNKPVFLEDTGEKLGTVFDMIYDGEKKLIGYKIKDKKSDSVLSFPIDQFDETKEGLIFIQNWYTNALKTLDRLEFKERVSPELTTLLTEETISVDELYKIFIKHDDQMVNYIDEAISLKELLNQRLGVLEKHRIALKNSLMDLTEKRLIKDIDRREFSEDVANHRRKVNVLDINIKKCKDLINRLEATSFGRLGKQIPTQMERGKKIQFSKKPEEFHEKADLIPAEEIENPYKQKYDDIKLRFNQLQEEYNELKLAVEKIIAKDEL